MDTIKEITIKEIDCAYETLERVLGMGGMENVKEVLWQVRKSHESWGWQSPRRKSTTTTITWSPPSSKNCIKNW